jgi:cation transport regulator
MPYRTNDDLPARVRSHLPPDAQAIYREAFNSAWVHYASEGPAREEICHRIAWAAVKRRYRKADVDWVPK